MPIAPIAYTAIPHVGCAYNDNLAGRPAEGVTVTPTTVIQLEIYLADLESRIEKLCTEEIEVKQRLKEEYAVVSLAAQFGQVSNDKN